VSRERKTVCTTNSDLDRKGRYARINYVWGKKKRKGASIFSRKKKKSTGIGSYMILGREGRFLRPDDGERKEAFGI